MSKRKLFHWKLGIWCPCWKAWIFYENRDSFEESIKFLEKIKVLKDRAIKVGGQMTNKAEEELKNLTPHISFKVIYIRNLEGQRRK